MGNYLYQSAFRVAESMSAAGAALRPPPRPEEILLLTAYTSDIARYGEITAANKLHYSRRHGYSFRAVTKGFVADRPPAWSKIHFIREALREFKWVFWSDADSLIMNQAVRIETLYMPGCDVVLTEAGCPFRHVNTGSMLFRSSTFSRLFLNAVWRLKIFTHDSVWEQRAINHLCENYRFRRLAIVHNRRCNSFAGVPNDPAPYKPGDFIVHFPGLPDRGRRLAEFAACVRPHG